MDRFSFRWGFVFGGDLVFGWDLVFGEVVCFFFFFFLFVLLFEMTVGTYRSFGGVCVLFVVVVGRIFVFVGGLSIGGVALVILPCLCCI